jgi:hypothetical protein
MFIVEEFNNPISAFRCGMLNGREEPSFAEITSCDQEGLCFIN